MATAISLITRAMKLARVLSKGEQPDADESADGLAALNSMMDALSIQRDNCYYVPEETLTLVPNQATYTMGSGGDLNTTRPTRIEDACFIRYTNYDLQLELLNFEAYAGVVAKTTASTLPSFLFVDMQNPLVRLTFWPVPTSASAVAHIFSWKQLQQFAALTDVLALPPGYEEMIAFNLAVRWACPEFGQPVTPEVAAMAIGTLRAIKNINSPSPVARSEAGLMTRRWPAGSIIWGGP